MIKCCQRRAPTTRHRHPLSETQMFIKLLPRRGPLYICQALLSETGQGGSRSLAVFALQRTEQDTFPSRAHPTTLDEGAHLGSRLLCRVTIGAEDLLFGGGGGEMEVRNLCFTGNVLTFKPGVMQGIVSNNFLSSVTGRGEKKCTQKFKGQTCFSPSFHLLVLFLA